MHKQIIVRKVIFVKKNLLLLQESIFDSYPFIAFYFSALASFSPPLMRNPKSDWRSFLDET